MAESIFEEYLSYIHRKKRLKKILPSLIILGVYAIAYAVMIIGLLNKNAVVAFVCSCAILVCSILLIAKPLTTNEKMGVLGWLEAIAYFTVSIVLISAFIFSAVPDDNKNVAITILSTCIGGFITLYSVGITIKYSRIDKREDELKKIRPNIVPISNNSWVNLSSDKKYHFVVAVDEIDTELKKANQKSKKIEFQPIRIANIGDSMATIFGVIVNDKFIKFDYESVLLKDSFNELVIDYKFGFADSVDEIIMVFEDIQKNVYFAKMRYDVVTRKNSLLSKIEITSVLEMRMVDENFNYLK